MVATHRKPQGMSAPRLQKLLDKREQLDAQIKALEARTRTQERKNDTRRKIIWGALAMTDIAKHPDTPAAKHLRRLADEYVTRPGDRALLGLSPLPDQGEATALASTLRTEFSG